VRFEEADQMTVAHIDIRSAFNDFVEVFGGIVTDRTLKPSANTPANADYIFPKHSVVAELKCLEEEFEAKEDFVATRHRLVEQWVTEKLVDPAQVSGPVIYTKEFPEQCQRDLARLYGRSIKASQKSQPTDPPKYAGPKYAGRQGATITGKRW